MLGDIMKKVVNQYVYDYAIIKRFYQVNLQTGFYLFLLILVLFSTISSFLEGDYSFGIFSLIILLLGAIYYFCFPTLLARMAYKKIYSMNSSKNVIMKITIHKDKIEMQAEKSSVKETYLLSDVVKVKERKDVICLMLKNKVSVLLTQDGFTSGDKDVLYSLIMDQKSKKK